MPRRFQIANSVSTANRKTFRSKVLCGRLPTGPFCHLLDLCHAGRRRVRFNFLHGSDHGRVPGSRQPPLDRLIDYPTGLAKNILTTRLRKLVECGVMAAAPAPDNASHNEYVLTEKGEKLYIVEIALQQWGAEYCFGADEHPITMVDSLQEAPLPALQLRSRDDRILGPRDIKAVDKPRKVQRRVNPAGVAHADLAAGSLVLVAVPTIVAALSKFGMGRHEAEPRSSEVARTLLGIE
jgi:DNA-binding HxlR family transcriptional regulator